MEWGQIGKASVLMDGQFGSTGKGLFAAYLAHKNIKHNMVIATTNAGANAGHTTKYRDGQGFVTFHLPTTGVVIPGSISYLNAGSVIDLEMLQQEIKDSGADPSKVRVHPRAAIITQDDRMDERSPGSSTERLASTQKGVGRAQASKVLRKSALAGSSTLKHVLGYDLNIEVINLNDEMRTNNNAVVVEVPQGFSLSLNHGFSYPFCTSRDCWVGSGLADAGIHPSFLGQVVMVVRTFPIRVGHIYDNEGRIVGNSGPFYPDSIELKWEDFPGLEPERTTVTKRVRRIASWSDIQYKDALVMNRPDIVALNFCNYLSDADALVNRVMRMKSIEDDCGLKVNHLFGFGPCVEEIANNMDAATDWYEDRRL